MMHARFIFYSLGIKTNKGPSYPRVTLTNQLRKLVIGCVPNLQVGKVQLTYLFGLF